MSSIEIKNCLSLSKIEKFWDQTVNVGAFYFYKRGDMFKSFVDQKLSPSQRRKRNKYDTEFTYKDLIERSIRRRKKTNASFTFIRDIKVTEAENQVEKAQEKMIHILPTIIDSNKPSLKISPSYDSFTDGNLGFLNSNEITEERRMSILTKLNTVRNANQSSCDVLLLSRDLSENKKVNELDNIPSIYINNSKNFESKVFILIVILSFWN